VFFILIHRLTAAGDGAFASLGHDELGTALRADVPLTGLICHLASPLSADFNHK
jgi:hypothetical protein